MEVTHQGHVTAINNNGIATITFGHPAHNSLPGTLLTLLTKTIEDVGNEENIKAIILRSDGNKTFCAGASFDELASIQDFETGLAFFSGFANVINAMRKCPKPILGRVAGRAIGGGVGLAAAMDYCMATTEASIKLSELAVGIGPFVVGPAVERKVGVSAFSELALNATEWRTAAWAKGKGLYNEVFDTVEQLDSYLLHFANLLSNSSPDALRSLKEVIWQGTAHWDTLLYDRAAISGRLVLSDFTKEAIAAFKAK